MGTGCLVLPAHWDAPAQTVLVRNGTPHGSINPRLTASNAAGEAQEIARKQGRLLPEAKLRAAVARAPCWPLRAGG